jgi:hypothetical protein
MYVHYRRQDLPLGLSDMFFQDKILMANVLLWGEWDMYLMGVWWRGGYGRINGGLQLLELAADSREAAPC